MVRVCLAAALLAIVCAVSAQAQIISNPVLTSWAPQGAVVNYAPSTPVMPQACCTPPVVSIGNSSSGGASTTYYAPAESVYRVSPTTSYYTPRITTYYAPTAAYYAPARVYYAPTTAYYGSTDSAFLPAVSVPTDLPSAGTISTVPTTSYYAPASPRTSYYAPSVSGSANYVAPSAPQSGCGCQGR